MCEAAGIKGGCSRYSVVIDSGVDAKGSAALDCRAGTKGVNDVLVTKGGDSMVPVVIDDVVVLSSCGKLALICGRLFDNVTVVTSCGGLVHTSC